MRTCSNVIERVKDKIEADIEPIAPEGVKIVTTYDRSDLIHRSIDTLKDEIIKLAIAVSVVCLVFLFHLPSALVVILTLPVAIIMSFICMYLPGGHLQHHEPCAASPSPSAPWWMPPSSWWKMPTRSWRSGRRRADREAAIDVIIDAAKEVGPSLFFSLLVITVGFLPVFTLQAQAGRLFKPLAYTKTFAMLFSSLLAVTLTPVLMTLFIRGKIRPEERNPVSMILRMDL